MDQELNLIARVKSAIKRKFLVCPRELELWYADGLMELILLEVDLKCAEAKRIRNEVKAA